MAILSNWDSPPIAIELIYPYFPKQFQIQRFDYGSKTAITTKDVTAAHYDAANAAVDPTSSAVYA